jgi:lipopolysaccharide heptosyltransferase I
MGLPALVALRRQYPQAYLAWLVEEHLADLVRGHECLDEVLTIRRLPARQPLEWWREAQAVGRQLRERRFDVAVDLQGRGKSAYMCHLSGAPRRVGFADEFLGLPGWRWINETVRISPDTHAVPRSLLMAEYLGAAPAPAEFRYPVLPEARAWAQEFRREHSLTPEQPLVALVLGASTAVKSWPPEHFAELIAALRAAGRQVVLIGGPAEAEREAAVQAALTVPAASAVGRTSLTQLAALLGEASVVVAGDTGALHMAVALDRPVVGLFGPTSPRLSGPWGPQHRVLWDEPTCGPCGRRPTCQDFGCMRKLTPDRVGAAVEEILAN